MAKYLEKDGLTYFWSKVKTYVDGKTTSILPPVTTSDDGKVLTVVNGRWVAVDGVQSAAGVTF